MAQSCGREVRRFPDAVKMTQMYMDGDFGRGICSGLKES